MGEGGPSDHIACQLGNSFDIVFAFIKIYFQKSKLCRMNEPMASPFHLLEIQFS
jgi:hypothetical protein